jgi:hypothetical protein
MPNQQAATSVLELHFAVAHVLSPFADQVAYASNCVQFTLEASPRVKPLPVKARFWL